MCVACCVYGPYETDTLPSLVDSSCTYAGSHSRLCSCGSLSWRRRTGRWRRPRPSLTVPMRSIKSRTKRRRIPMCTRRMWRRSKRNRRWVQRELSLDGPGSRREPLDRVVLPCLLSFTHSHSFFSVSHSAQLPSGAVTLVQYSQLVVNSPGKASTVGTNKTAPRLRTTAMVNSESKKFARTGYTQIAQSQND